MPGDQVLIRLFLVALIGCMLSQSLAASPSERWREQLSGSEMSDREIREHWLRSKLKFSGRSSMSREGLDGQLGVAADNLMGENHALGMSFRDAKSQRNANGSKALDLDYSFPVGSADLSLRAGNHHSEYQKHLSDQRIDASSESRVMGLDGSRFLLSRYGIRFDGLVRHVARDTQSFEQGDLVSDSAYQKSALGLKGQWSEELVGGLYARSDVSAIGGREFSASDYAQQSDVVEEGEFYNGGAGAFPLAVGFDRAVSVRAGGSAFFGIFDGGGIFHAHWLQRAIGLRPPGGLGADEHGEPGLAHALRGRGPVQHQFLDAAGLGAIFRCPG